MQCNIGACFDKSKQAFSNFNPSSLAFLASFSFSLQKDNLLIILKRYFLISLIFGLLTNYSYAQTPDSLQQWLGMPGAQQTKTLTLLAMDTLVLDSLTIVPSSVLVVGSSDSCWSLDGNRLLRNLNCLDVTDSIVVSYRTLPYAINQLKFRKDRRMIGQETNLGEDIVIGQGYSYNPYAQSESLSDFKGLEYSGSFARGISMGNRQDLILNSSFNMQVSGKIGDVEITGAISDNNIPLQPEGNTQQLQDFDRIYMQFKVKKTYLLAGDYDLQKPKDAYFMNYYRRLQGGQIGTGFTLKNNLEINTDASFAISKGTFTRNIFNGQEGNQGPYRLKGAKGELFIIILAGTERVFMDGELLSRGTDQDYVIDYNLGEIIFTNKRLITKDKRIQVEFSYTDLNFLRTIYTLNTGFKYGKGSYRINWYSEQDAKNQPAQAALSDSAKAVLRRVGDDIENAFIWGASIPEDGDAIAGLVRYELRDTIVAGIFYDSILVVSSNESTTLYTARFSQITTGGHYIRVNDATNGTIYRWIAPDTITGALLGTHEPIELLSTPKKRQLLNVGADYQLGKNGVLQSDFALSNHDLNTFSSVGNNDNQGIAARLSYQHRVKLTENIVQLDSTQTKKNRTDLLLGGHYEFVQDRFELIEPYRPREFQRDWNTDFQEQTNEHLFRTTIGLQNNKWGIVQYEFGGLLKDTLYNGLKHALNAQLSFGGLSIKTTASTLNAKTQTQSSQFLRPKIDLSYQIKKWKGFTIGIYDEIEQNRRKSIGNDSLLSNSIYYHVVKAYALLPADDQLMLKASALRRFDYTPVGNTFQALTVADELNFGGNWLAAAGSRLEWNLNYRNLRIQDTLRTSLDPKETYLGRVEYNLNIRKGFIRLNTIYELGAGQQQKIAYNYIEVDKGQGTHIWIDRNEDGQQQQNEFEVSVYQDLANFLRVTVLTNEFIRSNNVSFSQSLDIEPSVFFRRTKTKEKQAWAWLGRLSSRSLFKIERKTIPSSELLAFNPFVLNVSDTALVSIGSTIRNIIYLNRAASRSKFRMEIQQSDSRSKTLLNIGFDTRRRTEYLALPSLNFTRSFRAQFKATYGFNDNNSEFFPDRDYQLEYYELKPELMYMYKTSFRASLSYKYKDSRNLINNLETAISNDISVELKYFGSKKAKTNIRTTFSWVNLNFEGTNNTPVQFTMTEGLQNGQNFLWTLNIDRSISKNIQLNIGYEGRKTGDAKVVHVARAQIRAVF